MDDDTLHQAVDKMIKLHGGQAMSVSALKAEDMLAKGNIEGFYAWNRICAAITDIERKARPPAP